MEMFFGALGEAYIWEIFPRAPRNEPNTWLILLFYNFLPSFSPFFPLPWGTESVLQASTTFGDLNVRLLSRVSHGRDLDGTKIVTILTIFKLML